MLGGPQQFQQQKNQLIDTLSPLVRQLSPKWSEEIIEVLKQMDISELLELAKCEESLKTKVQEEEIRLERARM